MQRVNNKQQTKHRWWYKHSKRSKIRFFYTCFHSLFRSTNKKVDNITESLLLVYYLSSLA